MEPIRVIASEWKTPSQPQPFPMQGSKRGQVAVINQLIPSGQPRLIEPFCGSAAMAIGARNAGLVSGVILSDLNGDLVNLWQKILASPDELCDEYEKIWATQFEENMTPRDYFNRVRERFNAAESGDAADFLFLLNRIVKAAIRYSSKGMNQSADGRRVGAKPTTVRSRIVNVANLLHGAEAKHRDWRDALAEANEDDVIYLDPPYQGTSGKTDTRYQSGLGIEEFEAGIRDAVLKNLSMIISYDAIAGPVKYGRALDRQIGLLPLDVVTGVSAQGTLLGRSQPAHEALYISPALVDRLGGTDAVCARLSSPTRLDLVS